MDAKFIRAALLVGLLGWLAIISSVALFLKTFAADYLSVPCCSYHLRYSGQNQLNLGIGFEREVDKDSRNRRLMGGVYNNSSNNASFYFGGIYQPYAITGVRLGTFGALVTGYQNKPIPLIASIATFDLDKKASINLLFIPAGGGITAMQFRWRLD